MFALVLTFVSTSSTVLATYFAVSAARAGRDATKLAEELLLVERETAQLSRSAVESQRHNRWMSALQETAEWVTEIADRGRRVRDGQPVYLLIHAVNRLQAALIFLPEERFPLQECRQMAQTHYRPADAAGRFVNALAEIEAAVSESHLA